MQLLTVALIILLAAPVYADQAGQTVYRWTDENGMVHYGTNPPAGDAQKILMRSPQAVSNDGKSEDARAEMHRKMLDSYQRDREIKQQSKEQEAAAKRHLELRCKQLTRHWKNLHHYGPIYYEDAQGGRRFLNEEERQAEKDALAKRLKKVCGKVPKP